MFFMQNIKIRSFVFHVFIAGILTLVIDAYVLPIDTAYVWFLCLNIVTFLSFGLDKLSARSGNGRTPEMTYHMLGVVGGFPGIFAGRGVFNHKTSKLGFIIPMWLFFFAQLVAVAWFYGDLETKLQKQQAPATKATTKTK